MTVRAPAPAVLITRPLHLFATLISPSPLTAPNSYKTAIILLTSSHNWRAVLWHAPDVICAKLNMWDTVPQMCTLSLLCKKSASPFESLLDALRGEGGGPRVQKVALPYYTLQMAASIHPPCSKYSSAGRFQMVKVLDLPSFSFTWVLNIDL